MMAVTHSVMRAAKLCNNMLFNDRHAKRATEIMERRGKTIVQIRMNKNWFLLCGNQTKRAHSFRRCSDITALSPGRRKVKYYPRLPRVVAPATKAYFVFSNAPRKPNIKSQSALRPVRPPSRDENHQGLQGSNLFRNGGFERTASKVGVLHQPPFPHRFLHILKL